jgi:chaperone required for assembly of F1-ATPase
MKRFYKQVAVTPEPGIALDGRPVRTPGRLPLILPNVELAEAVAGEWRAQGEDIVPHTMPLTGLANAAIERIAPDTAAFAAGLAAYAESELLCYRADAPPPLVARQAEVWDPILAWARARYDIGFVLVECIIHRPQPPGMLARLSEALVARNAFELAALSQIVTISGSLVIALAVIERALEPEAAFDAGHLDELWQAEQWGEDDFALDQRAARRTDFLAACNFLRLLGARRQEPAR